MVGEVFNNGREPWEVRIGRDEVFSFLRLIETLPPRPESDLFFYECRPDGTRIWHHVDQLVAVTHHTTGARTDERRILPFSEAALIGLANVFGWVRICGQVPQAVSVWIQQVADGPVSFMLLVNDVADVCASASTTFNRSTFISYILED